MLKEAGNYGAQEMSHLRIPLTKTLILILVNNEDLNYEPLKKLKYSLKNLIEIDQGSSDSLILLRYINSKDFSQLARDIKASKVKFSFKFVSLTLQSNLKQAEIEHEQCNQAYLNEQAVIARHINLKRLSSSSTTRAGSPRSKLRSTSTLLSTTTYWRPSETLPITSSYLITSSTWSRRTVPYFSCSMRSTIS